MGYKTLATCDRCGKEEVYINSPECYQSGWKSVSLETNGCLRSITYKKYFLCPDCCKALGIADPPKTIEEKHSLADRLLEIMVEIAQSAMPTE